MSFNIYISHTGHKHTLNLDDIPTPDILRQWIATNSALPITHQILMTAQGKNFKQQHLLPNAEIFVYDKSQLSGSGNGLDPSQATEPPAQIHEIPSELDDETSLASWQALFKTRRSWALQAVELVRDLSEKTSELADRCEHTDRAANVALTNLKNHATGLQALFVKTQTWAQATLKEHADILAQWRETSDTLKELPIRDDIAQLMTAQDGESKLESSGTMHSLLRTTSLENAEASLNSSRNSFEGQLKELNEAMKSLDKQSEDASALTQLEWPSMGASGLLEEAETMFKKIDADYAEVIRLAGDTKVISKVSRVAANHTNTLLPSLQEIALEAFQTSEVASAHLCRLSDMCLQVLRAVSSVQASLASMQARISNLSIDDHGKQALDVLDRVFQLPSAYGAILVEAVRRSEWNEKLVADLQNLKDELSQHKEDEVRRRKKWTGTMIPFLAETSTTTGAISDFTFSTPANPWPLVSRAEIWSYVDDLKALDLSDAVVEVAQAMKDIDLPVKSRKQNARTFKNGSIHEAMQNSFMRQNHDRLTQDERVRLEEKLRASESRIRKLEDLLHRQTQTSRPQSTIFVSTTEYEKHPGSPNLDTSRPFDPSSRRSSVSARRMSNQGLEDKVLQQRVVAMEAELIKLREAASIERRNSDQSREKMHQAESVKRDLLANFEAQRQEFDEERQRLEDDNHELKIKVEELEEELDRVIGSRDHEKTQQDQSITHFRSELERLQKTSQDELAKMREIRDNLQNDLSMQHVKVTSAEQHVQQLREERSDLETRTSSLNEDLRLLRLQQQDVVNILQGAHGHLSPAGSAPEDIKRLANALEVLAEGATFHSRGLDDQLQIANAQASVSDEKIENLELQIAEARKLHDQLEAKHQSRGKELRELQQMLKTARSDLADEKAEVDKLRNQFTAGESGSDSLKARLTEEEQKVGQLTSARDKVEVRAQGLEQNISILREEIDQNRERQKALQAHFDQRARRANELSEKLFQHNDRMVRMLENFGYSISRDGDGLLIQRASKANASQVIVGNDVGTPMKRQISGSVPSQHYAEASDALALYWTNEDAETESSKYDAFLSGLSRLDSDATTELLTKRYKDVETMAKRYQKDVRTSREKTHRLTSEAHDKIAYRAFKEGDLALFLPTRNQATKPWAAFNVGAPHYFLREQDTHRLKSRDWLLARINKVEERVVDLSRSMTGASTKGNADASDGASLQSVDDNPFELSDGLRWYLIDAVEEKPGAPSTPGLGKSTVAASVVQVNAHVTRKSSIANSDKPAAGAVNAAKTLHKSLDSRRSSDTSRKSGPPPLRTSASNSSAVAPMVTSGTDGQAEGTMSPAVPSVRPSEADLRSKGQAREDARLFEVAQNRRPALQRAPTSEGSKSSRVAKDSARYTSSSGKSWDKLFSFQYSS